MNIIPRLELINKLQQRELLEGLAEFSSFAEVTSSRLTIYQYLDRRNKLGAKETVRATDVEGNVWKLSICAAQRKDYKLL